MPRKMELHKIIEVTHPDLYAPVNCKEGHIFVSCGKLSDTQHFAATLKRQHIPYVLAVTHAIGDGVTTGNGMSGEKGEHMRLFTLFVKPVEHKYSKDTK